MAVARQAAAQQQAAWRAGVWEQLRVGLQNPGGAQDVLAALQELTTRRHVLSKSFGSIRVPSVS